MLRAESQLLDIQTQKRYWSCLLTMKVIEKGLTPKLLEYSFNAQGWKAVSAGQMKWWQFTTFPCCNCRFSFGLQDCDTDETWAQVSVGVLTVVREDVQLTPNQLHLHPVSTAIVVEGGIVMDDLQNLPEAFCLLFGLSYALHLDYPKAMKNTFNFIQRVMLGLGENKLPPKLQSLKNLLLS